MEIRDDDGEDDHKLEEYSLHNKKNNCLKINLMEDVQQIPPTPTVVALLPRADPPAPMPLEHPNPMLVSSVPITFRPGANLMGTGSDCRQLRLYSVSALSHVSMTPIGIIPPNMTSPFHAPILAAAIHSPGAQLPRAPSLLQQARAWKRHWR